MTKKNKLANLTKWQNYVHYVILTLGIVIVFHFLGVHVFHSENYLPNKMTLYLLVSIFIIDTLVHFTFASLPKKYGRWED
jgi:hypothetical protein